MSRMVQLAEAAGDPHTHWAALFIRSWRALSAGESAEAERLGTEALRIGTDAGEPDVMAAFTFQLHGKKPCPAPSQKARA
jgi:hypothetical protein